MNEKLQAILKTDLHIETPIASIEKLHGDASYRTYYRFVLEDGRTMIVMQLPEGKASASEEITNYEGPSDELPFCNVQRYLAGRGVPVPAVLHVDAVDGLVLLQDLGDDLLFGELAGAADDRAEALGREAVEALIALKRATTDGTPSDCIAFARSFDATLLNWEFDHFAEFGIVEQLGKAIAPADRTAFERETRAITARIEAMPFVFTHRDFQSKNLIRHDGRLFVIDFQDALMGPRAYDLVSLLRDSYIAFDAGTLGRLLDAAAAAMEVERGVLQREFDLVTVQRKLKDAGRFVYIDRIKGNPDYVQYIPRSLGYVREALTRLPEHAALGELLTKYIPEWSA